MSVCPFLFKRGNEAGGKFIFQSLQARKAWEASLPFHTIIISDSPACNYTFISCLDCVPSLDDSSRRERDVSHTRTVSLAS